MTDATARSRANKRKGATFETDLLAWIREHNLTAERLTKTGTHDEGDLAIRVNDLAVIVECKNEKAISLSTYMSEATTEALNYESHRVHDPNAPKLVVGVAAIKRRNSPLHKTYITMEADDFAAILLHLQGR